MLSDSTSSISMMFSWMNRSASSSYGYLRGSLPIFQYMHVAMRRRDCPDTSPLLGTDAGIRACKTHVALRF